MEPTRGGRFATTRWSLVLAAGAEPGAEGREALAALCGAYWSPVYVYVRACGHDPDAARDLTQGFFARLLEKRALRQATRRRGRFRSFLLASVKNFMVNEWDASQTQKRGGGTVAVPIDAVEIESHLRLRDDETPEIVFERRWALALLKQSLATLEAEMEREGTGDRFRHLRPLLVSGERAPSYEALAEQLDMSRTALKVAVHRLRQRFGRVLRQQVAETLAEGDDVDEELRHLVGLIGGR